MKMIGFSTGAIAFGDFRKALTLLSTLSVAAVELSALRIEELEPLIAAIGDLDLRQFEFISFHAPSRFSAAQEPYLVRSLQTIADRGWPIIMHPDSVHDPKIWLPLQANLCFENMDKRKRIGRTADELEMFLRDFPQANVCFDIGHAHQVDRTMTTARMLAQRFASRIRQIHVSEVTSSSEHVGISAATTLAFAKIVDLLDPSIPLIIESVVGTENVEREISRVSSIFAERTYALAETD
jgi:hypothetical protein